MKDINCINLSYKDLIVNQDKNGCKINSCYSIDGDCRECRYCRDCEWFKEANGYGL